MMSHHQSSSHRTALPGPVDLAAWPGPCAECELKMGVGVLELVNLSHDIFSIKNIFQCGFLRECRGRVHFSSYNISEIAYVGI